MATPATAATVATPATAATVATPATAATVATPATAATVATPALLYYILQLVVVANAMLISDTPGLTVGLSVSIHYSNYII